MLAKHKALISSCATKIMAGPDYELSQRVLAKARNTIHTERERERKKTPQVRRWNSQAWSGIFAFPSEEVSLQVAANFFEILRVAVAGLRQDGYSVEPDWYLETGDERQVYIAGVRFLSLLKRSEQAPE
jgi:hypothetical protein